MRLGWLCARDKDIDGIQPFNKVQFHWLSISEDSVCGRFCAAVECFDACDAV